MRLPLPPPDFGSPRYPRRETSCPASTYVITGRGAGVSSFSGIYLCGRLPIIFRGESRHHHSILASSLLFVFNTIFAPFVINYISMFAEEVMTFATVGRIRIITINTFCKSSSLQSSSLRSSQQFRDSFLYTLNFFCVYSCVNIHS